MTGTDTPRDKPSAPRARPGAPRVRLVAMSEPVLAALAEGDTETASALMGVELGEHFATEEMRWLCRYRLGQIQAVPDRAGWLTSVVVDADHGWAVGHAGFHGPPDERRMVEIGYSVVPEMRRRGYARACVVELLRRADAEPEVAVVRASIRPDNSASLATIAGFGFEHVGEQWDDIDGLEFIHERPSPRPESGA